MSQPKWKLVWSTDCSALFTDDTGVYEPELVIVQESGNEEKPFLVYRFPVEKSKIVIRGGVFYVVPEAYDDTWAHAIDQYEPWFIETLADVCRYAGEAHDEMLAALISDDASKRSGAYESIGGYYGFDNFDSYPRECTEKEMEKHLSV